MKRPTFDFLNKDVFYHCINALCIEQSDDADNKAVELINKYATPSIINHQQVVGKETCLIAANKSSRAIVVGALVKKFTKAGSHPSELLFFAC
jgi:hypothetical protein